MAAMLMEQMKLTIIIRFLKNRLRLPILMTQLVRNSPAKTCLATMVQLILIGRVTPLPIMKNKGIN